MVFVAQTEPSMTFLSHQVFDRLPFFVIKPQTFSQEVSEGFRVAAFE
jgi:hypothetical protein